MPRSKTFSEVIKKTYWSSGDIGRELKIRISNVTFWCKEFHIEPKRSGHNYRQFKVTGSGSERQAIGLWPHETRTHNSLPEQVGKIRKQNS